MTMKLDLNNALKQAMLDKDETRKNTLRMLLTAIKLAEVEKGSELDDASIFSLVHKEIKMRKETIEGAQKAGRQDLINQSEAEITVLELFLPKMMSPDELSVLVKSVIDEVGASTLADTGKVMKALMTKVQGRAPGDQVSQMVRSLLQG